MDFIQTICIALIQGVTEFLPISSSAHLLLPSLLFEWPDQGIEFDVATHAGSLVAVLAYYRHRLANMAVSTVLAIRNRRTNDEFSLVLKLIVATLPAVIVGLLAYEWIETEGRQLGLITANTIVFALILWLADSRARKTSHDHNLSTSISYPFAVLIGMAQALALMPGVSRAGVTMTAALFLGLGRTHSATFSFLLAIPVILAAFTLTSYDLLKSSSIDIDITQFVLGFVVAAISAYLCIDAFLKFIEKIGMLPFVIYRLALGIVLALFIWL